MTFPWVSLPHFLYSGSHGIIKETQAKRSLQCSVKNSSDAFKLFGRQGGDLNKAWDIKQDFTEKILSELILEGE